MTRLFGCDCGHTGDPDVGDCDSRDEVFGLMHILVWRLLVILFSWWVSLEIAWVTW